MTTMKPSSLKTPRPGEVKCKMQQDWAMSVEWCNRVQDKDLCGDCRHNENRDTSIYKQRKNAKERA